jgi:peptidoglycan/xylan/chitin deacetylase (PgdA/CDA1 family)
MEKKRPEFADMAAFPALKSIGHSMFFRSGVSALAAKSCRCARILMYHGILSRDEQAFRAQLQYFRRHFHVISMRRLIERLEEGRGLLGNEVVLTFDDGLQNNLTVAYPILRFLGMPATFFICPGLVSSGRWQWTHEMRSRLLTLEDLSSFAALCGTEPVGVSVECIIEQMKQLNLERREHIEEKIRHATSNFVPSPEQHEAYDVMGWSELRRLDRELITIGSHTMSHPILPTLPSAAVEREIAESRTALEGELDRPVTYFSYPNGFFHEPSYRAAKRNYRAAFSAHAGVLKGPMANDLYCLPRIAATKNLALMAWRLHRPAA